MKPNRILTTMLALLLACLVPLAAWAGGTSKRDQGTIFTGKVTAVDANTSTITFTNKANESRTVTLTPDTKVQVNGKAGTLAEVQVGMYGGVRLAEDGKTPLEMRAGSAEQKPDKGKFFTGKITAVDAKASSITFTNKRGDVNTVTLTAATKVQVNGQAATLADVQVDMYGGARLAEDGKTALEVRANNPQSKVSKDK